MKKALVLVGFLALFSASIVAQSPIGPGKPGADRSRSVPEPATMVLLGAAAAAAAAARSLRARR
jgi:hypothetical protein